MKKSTIASIKGKRSSSASIVSESQLQALNEISKAENLKQALLDIKNDTGIIMIIIMSIMIMIIIVIIINTITLFIQHYHHHN